MALQVRRDPSVKVRVITTLMMAFALVAQPFYGLVSSQVANATDGTTIYGPETAEVTEASPFDTGHIDTDNYNNREFSFEYDHELLDDGDSFTYEVSVHGVVQETVTIQGEDGDNPGYQSVVAYTASSEAQNIRFKVTASTNVEDDKVLLRNITLTGELISVPVIGDTTPVNNEIVTADEYTISAVVTDDDNDVVSVHWELIPATEGGTPSTSTGSNPDLEQNGDTWQQTYPTHNIEDGEYKLIFTATDSTGKTGTKTVDLTVGDAVIATGPVKNTDTNKHFDTIQAAIDDSDTTDGDTIKVLAATHEEASTVDVSKSINLIGDGMDNTVLHVVGNTSGNRNAADRGWFTVADGEYFNVKNLTLDGDSDEGDKVHSAIVYTGTSHGTIDSVKIQDIKYARYVGLGVDTRDANGTYDVKNSVFENIYRIGVYYRGENVSGTFANNTYTGKGDGDYIDYALDISAGADITVTGNTVTNNTGVAESDGSTSAGFLVTTFFGGGTSATFTNNDIHGNTTGIAIGYDDDDTSVVTAHHNNIAGNEDGITDASSGTVDVANNWWGSASGPSGEGAGTGDSVISGNVASLAIYEPWLCQPFHEGSRTSVDGTCVVNESPRTTLVAPTGIVGDEFTVSGVATDDNALNRVYVQLVNRDNNKRYGGTTIHLIGQGTEADWSKTYNANDLNLPDGDYAAHVSVVDMTGKTGSAGWSEEFTVDSTAPVISNVRVENPVNGLVEIRVDIEDDHEINNTLGNTHVRFFHGSDLNNASSSSTNVTFSYDAGNDDYVATIDTTTFADEGSGNYWIYVRAEDKLGNAVGNDDTRGIVVDNIAPTVDITGAQQVSKNSVEFSGYVNGENFSHYYCWITKKSGGGEIANTRGDNCVTTWAADLQRNGNPATSTNQGGGSVTSPVVLGDFDITGLASGEYTVHLIALDRVGNKSAEATYDVNIDHTSPVATLTITETDGAVTMTGSAVEENIKSHWFEITDPSGDIEYVNVSNATSNSHTFTINTTELEDGEYQVRYVATDTAGNRNDDPNYTNSTIAIFTVNNKEEIELDNPDTGQGDDDSTTTSTGEETQNQRRAARTALVGPQVIQLDDAVITPLTQNGNLLAANFAVTDQNDGNDEDENTESDNAEVLGTQDNGTPLTNTGAVETGDGVFDILGLNWYWWIGILAGAVAGWLGIAAVIRRMRGTEI